MNHFLLVRVAAAYELYTEELLLRPLRGDRTAAHFSFTIEDTFPTNGARSAHYHLIPRVFGEIVRRGAVRELEFSVAQGKWRSEAWGAAGLRSEVPGGASLWAWTDAANHSSGAVRDDGVDDVRWESVVRGVAGALNVGLSQLVDGAPNAHPHATTMRSPLAFDEGGAHAAAGAHFRRGATAVDVACVENLRSFLKLLPCSDRAGLAARLTSSVFVGAPHRSLRVRARRAPSGTLTLTLEAQLVVESSGDAANWTLDSLLPPSSAAGPNVSECALAQHSVLHIETDARRVLSPLPHGVLRDGDRSVAWWHSDGSDGDSVAALRLTSSRVAVVDDAAAEPTGSAAVPAAGAAAASTAAAIPRITIRREHYAAAEGAGVGVAGTLTTIVSRNAGENSEPLRVLVVEEYPSTVTLHYSSLRAVVSPVGAGRVVERRLAPNAGRVGRCASIVTELELDVGATVALSVGYRPNEAALEAYPSDPNRGRELPPAVGLYYIPPTSAGGEGSSAAARECRSGDVVMRGGERGDDAEHRRAFSRSPLLDATSACATLRSMPVRIYSNALLISGRHPDFSMTYNVITIVSTAMAFIFGTLFNLLTREKKVKKKKKTTTKKKKKKKKKKEEKKKVAVDKEGTGSVTT